MAETSISTEEECDSVDHIIDVIKNIYGDKVNVVENQGEFRYFVMLKLDISVRVSIMIPHDGYTMDVLLRCPSTWTQLEDDFHGYFGDEEMKITQLQEVVTNIVQWWSTESVTHFVSLHSSENTKVSKKTKKDKKTISAVDVNVDPLSKASKMKTAADVISRIQWDSSLSINSEHLMVGYQDRFVGVVERPFDEFDWSNFSEVDPEANAVPHHRIQYFKYGDVIIWDRKSKVDHVFGSTGGEPKLEMIIKQMHDKLEEFVENLVNEKIGGCYISLPINDPAIKSTVRNVCNSYITRFKKSVAQAQLTLPEDIDIHLNILNVEDEIASETLTNCIEILKDRKADIKEALKSCSFNLNGLLLLNNESLCSGAQISDLQPLVELLENVFKSTGISVTAVDNPKVMLLHLRKAKNDVSWDGIKNAVATSRFNATVIPDHLQLRNNELLLQI